MKRLSICFLFAVLSLAILFSSITFQAIAENPWIEETIDENAQAANPSLALDSSGRVHVSYFDENSGNLKYARKDVAAWSIETVDTAVNVGIHSSIGLDSGDRPHIAYIDSKYGTLKYAHWSGNEWAITVVDASGKVNGSCSLVIDASNNAHISYYSEDGRSIRYAAWTGSQWTIKTVDSGNCFSSCSLRLDLNNVPHVAYFTGEFSASGLQSSNFTLKYAKWSGQTWTIENVVSANLAVGTTGEQYGPSGFSVSLMLDSSNRPRICFCSEYNSVIYANRDDSGWQTFTVASGSNKGCFLALYSNGAPHIIYQTISRYAAYANYTSWNGSSWETIVIGIMGHGTQPAIVLDVNDHPHVSFTKDGELYYATLPDLYQITFDETGVGLDSSETEVIIDLMHYSVTDLPKTFTWGKNSNHTYSYVSNLASGQDKRYVLESVYGLSNLQNGTINVSASGNITANYKTQFQVSLAANPSDSGSVIPSGSTLWFDKGVINISASAKQNHAFVQWYSNTGDITFLNKFSASTTAAINDSGSILAYFDYPPPETASISPQPSVPEIAPVFLLIALATVTIVGISLRYKRKP